MRHFTNQIETKNSISYVEFEELNTRGLRTSFWRPHLENVGSQQPVAPWVGAPDQEEGRMRVLLIGLIAVAVTLGLALVALTAGTARNLASLEAQ